MKKYLFNDVGFIQCGYCGNDDFKASVTAALWGQETSIYKGREENAIPIFPNLSYQNLYLKGTEVGFKFLDYSRFNSTLYVDLLDGHSIRVQEWILDMRV